MSKPLSIKEIFNKSNFIDRIVDGKSHITEEFQDFGYRLAVRLEDIAHKALYIKFAKELPRGILEEVMQFTLDYPVKSGTRARIFMWKLHEICKEKNIKMSFKRVKKASIKKQKPQLDLWINKK